MRLLIDTQILLRALYDPGKLPAALAARLIDPANDIVFSTVSIAEIAIKASLKRADFPFQPEDVDASARSTGFTEIPLTAQHAIRLAGLPWHHRDPFDRMLVAQTLDEGLRFLTTDVLLTRYSDLVETT